MKPYLYSLIAAAAVTGLASAQTTAYTIPVGYVTKSLPAAGFSYLGLTLNTPVVSAGVLDASSSNSVTDTGVNFSTLLTAGKTYILELENGTIQEITAWDALGKLTTPENISGQVTNGTTTYKLRKASYVTDVFGANNSAGITPDSDGDYTTLNDLIYVFTTAGLKTIYYFDDDGAGPNGGWFDSDGNDGDYPIVYADGFYINRVAGSTISLVTNGEVKKFPTSGVLGTSWNFLSSVAPTGLTLGTSGLKDYITPDTVGDYLAVDNVYVVVGGLSKICYYFDDDGAGPNGGWFDSDGEDATNYPLAGDFLLLNRGVAKPYKLSVPTTYSNF